MTLISLWKTAVIENQMNSFDASQKMQELLFNDKLNTPEHFQLEKQYVEANQNTIMLMSIKSFIFTS